MGGIRAIAKEGYTEEELARCNADDFFQGKWVESQPQSAGDFSDVAWIKGSTLPRQLNVPVGLIQVAVGGSAINNWLPPDILQMHPHTSHLFTTSESIPKL